MRLNPTDPGAHQVVMSAKGLTGLFVNHIGQLGRPTIDAMVVHDSPIYSQMGLDFSVIPLVEALLPPLGFFLMPALFIK